MEHGSLITFKPDGTPVRVADVDLAATVQKMLGIIKIEFLPYRPDELPDFYYFCNGDRYPTDSPQGEVLLSTSANFKLDWGITVVDDTINVPNMFYTDGRGFFVRAVDGTTKQVGSIKNDEFRSHSHKANYMRGMVGQNNQYWAVTPDNRDTPYSGSEFEKSSVAVDPVLPTGGEETHPLYIGMTPAIRLGV